MRHTRMWMSGCVSLFSLVMLNTCGGGEPSGTSPPPPPPPPPPNGIQLSLQASQRFQTWEAWRGTINGPIFINQNGAPQTLAPALLNSILDDLVNDLGINGVRFELHSKQNIELTNDDADPNHINWAGFDFSSTFQVNVGDPPKDPVAKIKQMVIPMRQRVLARGEPFSLYVSLIYDKSEFPSFWLAAPPAPALPGDEYAEMAQAAVLWLQNQSQPPAGFTTSPPLIPNYWAVVNEPDVNGFVASDLAKMITRTGARFASMGWSTKIQTVESAVPSPGLLSTVLNSPGVGQYVGLISFHGYDYSGTLMPGSFSTRNAMRTAAQNLSAAQGRTVETAMTEICCRSGWSGGYNQALGWARDIYWNMTEADISVWEPLALMLTCPTAGCTTGGQDPILIDKDLSRTFKLPHYWGLRQFSKFIRPGYQRVGFTCGNCSMDATLGQNVKPLAFQSAAGKIVAVVINDQSVSQVISLLSLPAGTYDITGVDPTSGQSPVTYPAQTIGAGQTLTVTFPAQAILTFAQR